MSNKNPNAEIVAALRELADRIEQLEHKHAIYVSAWFHGLDDKEKLRNTTTVFDAVLDTGLEIVDCGGNTWAEGKIGQVCVCLNCSESQLKEAMAGASILTGGNESFGTGSARS